MMLLSQARLCIADVRGAECSSQTLEVIFSGEFIKQLPHFCVHCKSSETALKLKCLVIYLFNAYIITLIKKKKNFASCYSGIKQNSI